MRSTIRSTRFALLLGVALQLGAGAMGGCAHEPRGGQLAARPAEYVIGREDVLEVTVWKDEALSKTVPVRSDGRITLPLAGEFMAAGKTPQELAREIKERLLPLVKHPTVQVIVRETNSARVYVVGEVTRPGMYRLHGTVTPIEAIAMAGGLTEFAKRGGITVIRRTKGTVSRMSIDFDDLVKGKVTAQPLAPGDTVYVP